MAIANHKVGNKMKKLIEKLENARGESKWVVEDASPPHRMQVSNFNPGNIPVCQQDQSNHLWSVQCVNERKDVIGQESTARS